MGGGGGVTGKVGASKQREARCRMSSLHWPAPCVTHCHGVCVCVCVHACAHNTAITVARAITYICIAAAPLPTECVCVSGRRLIDLR